MLKSWNDWASAGWVPGLLALFALGLVLPASASATYDVVGEVQVSDAQGIASDAAGDLYVARYRPYYPPDHGSPEVPELAEVRKYNADGTLLTIIGGYGAGDSQIQGPSALATDAAGNLFVADAGQIKKFDDEGNFLTKWGSTGSGDGQFQSPSALATDAANNVYVADSISNRVQKFDSDGNFLTKWGSTGSGSGQFQGAVGIATDAAGTVYVTDDRNDRVQKFDSDGNFLSAWGGHGSLPGRLYDPLGIATGADGKVYVMDFNNGRVQQFDSDGNFIDTWRSPYSRVVATYTDASSQTYVYAGPTFGENGLQVIRKYGIVPFDTTITARPAGTTRDSTPTFRFAATRPVTGFECSLDSQPFSPCSSPLTLPAQADGYHELRVRGRDDDLAYIDPTPATASTFVDTVVTAAFDIVKVQYQEARSIAVSVGAEITNAAGGDSTAHLKAAGKIVVNGRRLSTTYDLQQQAVLFPFLTPGTLRLTPQAPGVKRKIRVALRRGAKVRAPIEATLRDGVGNTLHTQKVIRLKAAK